MLAGKIGREPLRPPLAAGDIAPSCALPALDGAGVDLCADHIAGNPIVVLFCPKFLPAVVEAVAAISAAQPSFAAAEAWLFAVTLEPAKVAAAQNILFPLLRDRDGEFHGHRDDVEPTPYRRFAMSINLNIEEFTGGELRFPEFGDQHYRPENGTAIVFSSSLLHEALHVASGRRLVLLAFLFGEY